jgi:hypothetical protein
VWEGSAGMPSPHGTREARRHTRWREPWESLRWVLAPRNCVEAAAKGVGANIFNRIDYQEMSKN